MPILTPEERLGTLLADRYRLEAIIGRGGAGVLFRAVHRWTGRQVAVKMMHQDRGGELSLSTRLLAEARAASELKHPNVVEVLDADLVDGVPFVVMELLTGRSLGEQWRLQGAVTPQQALHWILPVIGAVAIAHRRGILHRDIKLDNIFLAAAPPQGVVPKLLDFGLARPVDAASFVTESGAIVGTPGFMAPEQARGEQRLGPGVDVWALGVVLFALLSGRLPFEGDTPTALLVKIVTEPAPRLGDVAPGVPKALAAAVDRALRRELSLRYQSAEELAQGLAAAALSDGISLPNQPDPIGLTDWSRWLAGTSDSATANIASSSIPFASTVALRVTQRFGSSKPWSVRLIGAAIGFTAMAALAYWKWPKNAAEVTPSSEGAIPAPQAELKTAPVPQPPAPDISVASPSVAPAVPPSASSSRAKPASARGASPSTVPSAPPASRGSANPMVIDKNYE